jgi:hypothetical protein
VGFQLVREIEYDNALLLVLLLTMYNILIPSPIIVEVASFNLLTLVVFGSLAPIKEAAMVLLKVEMSFFQASKVFSPLEWLLEHEKQFFILDPLHIKLWGLWVHKLKSTTWMGSS